MPYYVPIKRYRAEERRRVANGLLRLREQLNKEVPRKTFDETLLLATWNIREVGNAKSGLRKESLHYIAEIISRFDLIAVQEVRGNLGAFEQLMDLLGPWWSYLITDVTAGRQGNEERLAFIYNERKVRFNGLAGEIVLPPRSKEEPVYQFARTPFMCGFKCGWSRFNICTVHHYYGDSKPIDEWRLKEIRMLVDLLLQRNGGSGEPVQKTAEESNRPTDNLILLGDFNIFKRTDETYAALAGPGRLTVPEEILKLPRGTNAAEDKNYDQIAYLKVNDRFGTTGKAGIFNFYRSVYRADAAGNPSDDEDGKVYAGLIDAAHKAAVKEWEALTPEERKKQKRETEPKPRKFKEWRTYHMSDHLVLWVELKIDYTKEYLEGLAK